MVERGQSPDVAPACPFVAFDDERDERSDRPDPRHRCYAETPPSGPARQHQEQFCLSPGFAGCPIFRTWARREAARVAHPSPRQDGDLRLRDAFGGTAGVAASGTGTIGGGPGPAPERPRFGEPPPAPSDQHVPDIPPRPVQQGPWSQPPPWLHAATPAGSSPDDDDRLDRLVARRGSAGAPSLPGGEPPAGVQGGEPAAPGFLTRPGERPAGAGLAGSIADESAAAALASRLAALGMPDDAAAPPAVTPSRPPEASAPVVTESAAAPPQAGSGAAPVRRLATPEDDIIGARVVREPGASGGLSRILRWGRPQELADGRGGAPGAGGGGRTKDRGRGSEPTWERPRRYEAYPAIRTRVGMPGIPRVLIGAVALMLAAAFLFFVVPSFFLGERPPGPGASSGASGAVASPSAAPSRTPARSAAPTPRVYVVRSGDTLSRIAERFGLTVDEILEANPNIKNPNQIAIGDRIVIPTTPSASPGDVEESPDPNASP